MPSQAGQANHFHPHHYPRAQGLASSAMPSTSSTFPSSSTQQRNSRQNQRNGTSRSPSLSHSTESRLSSPDLLVRTPDDERRLSGLSLSDSGRDAILLPPPNMKRKSPHYSTNNEEQAAASYRHAKRISPDRQTLPSISNLLPSSDSTTLNAEAENKRANSPRSLQHILNQELRPLSLSNYRAQTSDVRSSSSDEDELAE